jgi:predicted dinucleotide-binding enzyme
MAATKDAIQVARSLAGKVVVDCTNPLKEDNSGLALGYATSGAEQVAEWARGAKVVKALNQAGFNIMGNPVFEGQRAVMFDCGDDAGEKSIVLKLVAEIGFEGIDAGNLVIARLLEPYAMLWIHLAYGQGMGREFAFGLLRHREGPR